MNKPTFMILGACKSGTTTIYHYLNQHPEILMSTPKEPMFFEAEYERGAEFYWNQYFKRWQEEKAIGEARVANLFLPFVPERIKETLPNAKLIVILRNPIDRAYSHWWMKHCMGYDQFSFEDALHENLTRIESGISLEGDEGEKIWRSHIQPHRGNVSLRIFIDAGYYAVQLKRYLKLFSYSQIKILFFEDLRASPRSVLQDVCNFIGIDPCKVPKTIAPQNEAFTTAEIPIYRLYQSLNIFKIVPKRIRLFVKTFISRFGDRPRMSQETRNWLIDHYFQHNRDLEKIVKRDLSFWNSKQI